MTTFEAKIANPDDSKYTLEDWESYLIELQKMHERRMIESFIKYDDGTLKKIHYKLNEEDYKKIKDEMYRVSSIITVLKNTVDLDETPKAS